jgi:long-chain acyl-CoA synthetase
MTEAYAHPKPFVCDPWLTAQERPTEIAVVAPTSLTWAELVRQADALGAGLERAGVPDGGVISTTVRPGPDFFALALACLRYGFGLFPCDEDLLSGEVGASLQADAGVALHIEPDGPQRLKGIHTASYEDILATGVVRPPKPPAERAGFLAFATSGTTGDPVAVVRSRPWYPYKGVAVMGRYAAGPHAGAHVMANPTFHLGTVGPALYALQAGSPIVVADEWSVEMLGELIERHRADSVFVSTDQLIDLAVENRWNWRRPQVVLHGGSSCAIGVKRACMKLLGPVLHEFYGTSACLISEISAAEWLSRPGSAGRPLPGVKVSVRQGGLPVREGELGEICVMPRAIDRVGSGAAAAPLATSDLGYVDQDGYVYVVGRMTDAQPEGIARLECAIRGMDNIVDAVVLPVTADSGVESAVDCLVEALPTEWSGFDMLAPAAERCCGHGPSRTFCRAGDKPSTIKVFVHGSPPPWSLSRRERALRCINRSRTEAASVQSIYRRYSMRY